MRWVWSVRRGGLESNVRRFGSSWGQKGTEKRAGGLEARREG